MTDKTTIQVTLDLNDPAIQAAIKAAVLKILAERLPPGKVKTKAGVVRIDGADILAGERSGALLPEAIERPLMDPVFARFLASGDISEIRSIPDHQKAFRNYMFCTLVDLKTRTVHVEKASTKRIAFGIMPPQYWDDEVMAGLAEHLKDNKWLRAVVFMDGPKSPFVINDVVFLEEDQWQTMGRLFNSLYTS